MILWAWNRRSALKALLQNFRQINSRCPFLAKFDGPASNQQKNFFRSSWLTYKTLGNWEGKAFLHNVVKHIQRLTEVHQARISLLKSHRQVEVIVINPKISHPKRTGNHEWLSFTSWMIGKVEWLKSQIVLQPAAGMRSKRHFFHQLFLPLFLNLNSQLMPLNIPKADDLVLSKVLDSDAVYWCRCSRNDSEILVSSCLLYFIYLSNHSSSSMLLWCAISCQHLVRPRVPRSTSSRPPSCSRFATWTIGTASTLLAARLATTSTWCQALLLDATEASQATVIQRWLDCANDSLSPSLAQRIRTPAPAQYETFMSTCTVQESQNMPSMIDLIYCCNLKNRKRILCCRFWTKK